MFTVEGSGIETLDIIDINKLSRLNAEVGQFLAKFGIPEGGEVILPLEDISYYPHPNAAVRYQPDFTKLLNRIYNVDYFTMVRPTADVISFSHISVEGRAKVETIRKAPLYMVRVELDKIIQSPKFKNFTDWNSQEMVTKMISPQALTPNCQLILQTGNEHLDGSFYTLDAEGSRWSLHLAPRKK